MKGKIIEIELQSGTEPAAAAKAYAKACRYLLQRYCEGCEEFESIDLFESVNGGTGSKGLFNTSSEV